MMAVNIKLMRICLYLNTHDVPLVKAMINY